MLYGDTNQVFPTEFQLAFLMPCKFKCHLPVFTMDCRNAFDKSTRNIKKTDEAAFQPTPRSNGDIQSLVQNTQLSVLVLPNRQQHPDGAEGISP